MAETFPKNIGKYEVQGIIAKGGMGVVYRAMHPSLHRPVVIKKMTARKNTANVERFKREAQILLDLQSPYIVHLFDYFTEDSYRYMVEELVDGMALDKLLQKQTVLSPQLAMLILQDACLALKYAHSKDIVHRDIKPGNILISRRAEIKLADFGIATEAEKEDTLTESGVALGTPAYMPPEQFENSASVDCRADIYALGIMLYEMVTGTKPYPGTLSIETLNTIKKGKYISPRKIDKKIPPVICRLIRKMLSPKAKKRYQSTIPILKVIKRYLKHYDIHSIRVQLAKLLMSKDAVKEQEYIPIDRKKKKVMAIVSAAVLFVCLMITGWMHGVFHKTVLRYWYTPVSIQMKMPATSIAGSDLPVNAFFFVNDGDSFPEVANSRRVLTQLSEKKVPSEKNAKNRTYTTKDVYLTHGNYRIKVVAGPYVWWKSFTVSKKAVIINADFLKNMRRNVSVVPMVYNSKTGKDISSISEVSVLNGKEWVPLEDYPKEKLISGNVFKFRFRAEGYTEEIFSLRLDWLQDALYISASLNPIGS